ncbi:Isochorismatase hydrolase [Epithele typhae]|uniref:Isochorismatase hydrolase n=1 Tax=Epithele typhae TaxID=378194 RepID=UPI002007778E|nr:Isochorismatase hydrolase [Epithele typhae]KAH9943013.1 Isochorismatase hydrolase [Epithele typhae]
MAAVVKLIPGRTVFFVCDIQTRFRTFIHGFDHVVATGNKMLKLAKVLDVPVIITEQNPRGTCSHAPRSTLGRRALAACAKPSFQPSGPPLHLGTFEKTAFSMAIPPVTALLKQHNFKSVVLFGIESHVCVQQSALDLLQLGYDVHVLADGVSSTRSQEVPIAIARMRQAGAQIVTSESAAFELQTDASKDNFKYFSRLIKEEAERTEQALEVLAAPASKL